MLATTAALVALATLAGAALHTPVDARGERVCRSKRNLWGDVRSLFGATY